MVFFSFSFLVLSYEKWHVTVSVTSFLECTNGAHTTSIYPF